MSRRRKSYADMPEIKHNNINMKAVVYARVSSAQQAKDGDGLEGQIRLCKERAKVNDIEVIESYKDGARSGKYEGIEKTYEQREGLKAMIEFLSKQNKEYTKIHIVIIDDMDRLVRDVQGRREIKEQIEKLGGAKVYSLKQTIENSPEGRMVQSITMATKQYAREANARQVKDKQRARMSNGYRPLWTPPGFKHGKVKGEQGKSIIKEDGREIIRDALLLYANGTLTNDTAIMNYLNTKGAKNKAGNKFRLDSIAGMLKKGNLLLYAGYIYFEKWDIELTKGKHEGIIDLEDVERIINKTNPKKSYYEKSSKTDIGLKLPLRGYLYDLNSGKKFTGGPSQGKKEIFYYYSVRAQQNDGKKSISIGYEDMHKEFVEYLDSFKPNEKELIIFEEIMNEVWNKKTNVAKSHIKDYEKRLKEIDREVEKFMNLILKSKNDLIIEEYENAIIFLKEEKENINMKLSSIKEQDSFNIDELLSNTIKILRNPRYIWDLGDTELQKLLIGVLFKGKIYYDKKSGFQTPEIPLIYSILSSSDDTNSELVDPRRVELLTSSVQTRRSTN